MKIKYLLFTILLSTFANCSISQYDEATALRAQPPVNNPSLILNYVAAVIATTGYIGLLHYVYKGINIQDITDIRILNRLKTLGVNYEMIKQGFAIKPYFKILLIIPIISIVTLLSIFQLNRSHVSQTHRQFRPGPPRGRQTMALLNTGCERDASVIQHNTGSVIQDNTGSVIPRSNSESALGIMKQEIRLDTAIGDALCSDWKSICERYKQVKDTIIRTDNTLYFDWKSICERHTDIDIGDTLCFDWKSICERHKLIKIGPLNITESQRKTVTSKLKIVDETPKNTFDTHIRGHFEDKIKNICYTEKEYDTILAPMQEEFLKHLSIDRKDLPILLGILDPNTSVIECLFRCITYGYAHDLKLAKSEFLSIVHGSAPASSLTSQIIFRLNGIFFERKAIFEKNLSRDKFISKLRDTLYFIEKQIIITNRDHFNKLFSSYIQAVAEFEHLNDSIQAGASKYTEHLPIDADSIEWTAHNGELVRQYQEAIKIELIALTGELVGELIKDCPPRKSIKLAKCINELNKCTKEFEAQIYCESTLIRACKAKEYAHIYGLIRTLKI